MPDVELMRAGNGLVTQELRGSLVAALLVAYNEILMNVWAQTYNPMEEIVGLEYRPTIHKFYRCCC